MSTARPKRIIVVGTSAGGLETLRVLVHELPPDLDAALLIAMHLSPHSPSLLVGLLRAVSALPVVDSADGMPIESGHIYVAPRDRHLLIDAGRIRLSHGPKENRHRPAIDPLFRSAAWSAGAEVIGVVLTGMLDDGTAGLWAIKDRGGVAVVQSPDDALYPSMPTSALRHVAVDHVLTVKEMPALLAELVRAPAPSPPGPPPDRLGREVAMAYGEHRPDDVMALGEFASVVCPSCQGALVTIREGPIQRYRCHTGHAFSTEGLNAALDAEVEHQLYAALRVLDERLKLSTDLAARATAAGDGQAATLYEAAAARARDRRLRIRGLLVGPGEPADAS